MAVHQKHLIEKANINNQILGGFSLDLVKAFHTFPRFPLKMALVNLGAPNAIASFCIKLLAQLVRVPYVLGSYGPLIPSSMGAPEGDCLSVLSMISLAACFYYRLVAVSPQVLPFAYTDNWYWFTNCYRNQMNALIATLNLTEFLKLTINFAKSWVWSTDKQFRQQCEQLQFLFPNQDVRIIIRTCVKDLGEIVRYNKSVSLGFIKKKFKKLSKKFLGLLGFLLVFKQKRR